LPLEGNGTVLICRACGHREDAGVFFGALDDVDHEDEAADAKAAWRAERRRMQLDVLGGVGFALFELDGRWRGERSLSGWGGGARDHIEDVLIRHHDDEGRWVEVACSRRERGDDEPESALRSALQNADESSWPSASDAAVALWLRARDRAVVSKVAAAAATTVTFRVDARPREFRMLAASDHEWAASGRVDDVSITVAGIRTAPEPIGLRRVRELRALAESA